MLPHCVQRERYHIAGLRETMGGREKKGEKKPLTYSHMGM
jgi:hypothetical protein